MTLVRVSKEGDTYYAIDIGSSEIVASDRDRDACWIAVLDYADMVIIDSSFKKEKTV